MRVVNILDESILLKGIFQSYGNFATPIPEDGLIIMRKKN
jgi:hypothetical protein